MLRARAARDGGRILLLTARDDELRQATISELNRLDVLGQKSDRVVMVKHSATEKARQAAWTETTADGARLVLVLGTRADHFPTDPALPVGGSPRSCPDNPGPHRPSREVLGPEAAQFGYCFFLLPVHVQ